MELQAVNLGSATLQSPIYNGAGVIKNARQVREIAPSAAGAITGGSMTVPRRDGNSGEVFYIWPDGSINTLGIPNPGVPGYKTELPEMVNIAHDHGKPFYMSSSGDTPEEFGIMAELIAESGADGNEMNLACPNKWHGTSQQGMFGFYPELIAATLDEVSKRVGRKKFFKLKMPPYSNPVQLTEIAAFLREHYEDLLIAIVSCNTFANSYMVRREKGKPVRPAITFGKCFGGYAGKGYHAIALGQAMQWQEALKGSSIQLVAVGGVRDGETAANYLQFAKADAVQVVTALHSPQTHEHDFKTFERILLQAEEIPEPAWTQTA